MSDSGKIVEIDIDQLDLDLANPRHEKMNKTNDVIAYLLSKERVMDLVEDIADIGMTNPMDLMGVVARRGAGGRKTYVAEEGNRRVCALQLLHDPEKVPAKYPGRKKIVDRLENLSSPLYLPNKIYVCLFKTKKGAKPWVDRMHNMESKGTRRRWRPDQQDRAMGGGRNRNAMAIMDLAQSHGLVDQEQREQKLTTVQRYVGNPALRTAFGLFRESDKSLSVVRNLEDFKVLFEAFIADARDGKLSSRSTANDIARYASQKVIECGVSQDTIDPVSLADSLDLPVKGRNRSTGSDSASSEGANDGDAVQPSSPPSSPQRRKTIGFDSDVVSALDDAKVGKLISLYTSCCSTPLDKNAPLITVGWWSILESLSKLHGNQSFHDYLNKDRITNTVTGIEKDRRNEIWDALQYISKNGNSTKHSATAGSFDGQQIANCIDIINPLLIKLLRSLPEGQPG